MLLRSSTLTHDPSATENSPHSRRSESPEQTFVRPSPEITGDSSPRRRNSNGYQRVATSIELVR
jgi:hypothetical protein